MRDILSLDSPLLYFGEVKSLEENFGMRDVKVVDNRLRRATHASSPALSLRRIDTDWRSQLLVEYSKDLDACMILDDQIDMMSGTHPSLFQRTSTQRR